MIRITTGQLKGVRLPHHDEKVSRPTTDRVRQAIFSILESRYIKNWLAVRALDAFAGTGAFGVEALSRGAKSAVFYEIDKVAAKQLQQFTIAYKLNIASSVRNDDFLKSFDHQNQFNLIFLDPPYHGGIYEKAFQHIAKQKLLTDLGIICVESDCNISFSVPDLFRLQFERKYGKSMIRIYGLETERLAAKTPD